MFDTTDSRFIELNGASIYCEARGAGPALIMVHAGVADSGMFDAQFEALAASFRVVRFDLRGFGRTTTLPRGFSNVGDLLGVLDGLEIDSAIVLGVSFGGRIAIDATLASPERVTALILGAPSVRGVAPSERLQAFWAEEEALLERGDLHGATELNMKLWVDGPDRTPDQVDPEVRQRVAAMQMRAFQSDILDVSAEAEPDVPAIDRLAEIRVPTLVLVGEYDLQEKHELAARLADEIPACEMHVLAGGAHLVNMEQPAAFNRAVTEFLARLELGRPAIG